MEHQQAQQTGFDGSTLYRWYVYTEDGQRHVSWASTAQDARLKQWRRVSPVVLVEPAGEEN